MHARHWGLGVLAALSVSTAAQAAIETFYFAPPGLSLSYFLPADSPLVGKEIVSTRIYFDVEVFPGSDAANVATDISFPILPFPGNENALSLTGAELNWSGAGTFNYFLETDLFDGTFISRRYGAETPGFDWEGVILETSRIEFEYIPEPTSLMLLALGGLVMRRR